MLSICAILLLSVLHAAFCLSVCLPLHHCFTHIYQQEREVNAILQDIAKSRMNIQQCLNGVSTVLQMSRRQDCARCTK